MTATRGFSQFGKNIPRMLKGKVPPVVKTSRQIADDLGIDARFTRGCNRLLNVDDAAFNVTRHTFFFLLQASGEYDVRMTRCFRHEELDDAKELQFLQRF